MAEHAPEHPFRYDLAAGVAATCFDRDFPLVLEVVGQVNGGHPAFAQLTLDAVAASVHRQVGASTGTAPPWDA